MMHAAVSLILVSVIASWASSDEYEEKAIQSGKFQYELIKRDSEMPRFGTCWTTSLQLLEKGCKNLNDDTQSRLALKFANCFLGQAGQKTYECPETTPISECLRGVDSNAFSAYSNFFTHTHNMCQFLQHQIWHQKTEAAISGLTATSIQVVDKLSNSSKLQDEIVKNQLETLVYQKQIAEHGSILSQSVEQSRLKVREMMQELRASTDEQRTMIFSIFDRVTKLQSLLLSEVSWLYTVLFYGGCLFAVYLATATKRTADARLWLFCILSLNVIVERLICSLTLVENDPDPFEVYGNEDKTPQALLHSRIWLARKVALAFSCMVLAYVALTFKDYNIINYKLLQDIQKQNADLCKALQLMKSGVAPVSTDVLDAKNSEDADDEFSDDDDNASFDSTQTDATWRQDRLSDDEDNDSDLTDIVEEDELSFETAKTTTPNNNDDNFIHMLSETSPVIYNVDSFDKPTPKRRGRPPGSKNSSRSATPQRAIENHGYNLRRRNNGNNATFSGFTSTSLQQEESVSDFAKSIFNMAKASHEASRAFLKVTQKRQKGKLSATLNVLSEDDD